MTNSIEIRNVSQHYNDKQILKNISLNIPEYSILGLVGENGAGKTTLMKSILGLIQISSGEIVINGEKVTNNRSIAMKDVAFILEPRYCSYLSPYSMLKYILILSNQYTKESKQEIIELLTQLKLDKVARKSIYTFSFGMKQRVALAVTLIRKPSVLILDEPLVGLDMQGIDLFNKVIKDLVDAKKCTVIISSHQLDEIEKISSEIAYIESGTLASYDTVENMVESEYWFTFESAVGEIPDSLAASCKSISLESDNILHIVSNDTSIFRKVSDEFSSNRILDMRKSENGLRHLFAEGTN
ncbi:MAG TPA: ABC transporter ATP-binding protein [Lachnospiraceae bacterium]|nr:ABC transporter ATP-binding protein [Lachnospiraceae bacterium]